MVLQYDSCGAQHTGDKNEHTKPTHRIVPEQLAERNQTADDAADACHVLAQLPLQVDNDADKLDNQCCQYDAGHVPGDIQFVHHHQAEHIRDDGERERDVALFACTHLLYAKTVDLAEQEDGEGRHQYSKAVHDS